ncbi:hypothetical protein G6539_23895, partial [Streptomyces albidoflavus]|nr:hypothetical protein [Streptomyces albidoflavus]
MRPGNHVPDPAQPAGAVPRGPGHRRGLRVRQQRRPVLGQHHLHAGALPEAVRAVLQQLAEVAAHPRQLGPDRHPAPGVPEDRLGQRARRTPRLLARQQEQQLGVARREVVRPRADLTRHRQRRPARLGEVKPQPGHPRVRAQGRAQKPAAGQRFGRAEAEGGRAGPGPRAQRA